MTTIPTDRTTENSANEHVSDHNVFAAAFNDQSLLLVPGDFHVLAGTPEIAALNSVVPAWLLDPDADEAIAAVVEFPNHWDSVHIDVIWATSATASGNIRLQAQGAAFSDGDTIGNHTVLGAVTTAAPESAYGVRVTRLVAGHPTDGGESHAIRVARLGSDAADTYTNDIGIIGVRLLKAS